MRCTGEIVFLCGAVKVGQRKIVTAFNDEAAGFLCSEFYTAATGNTVVELNVSQRGWDQLFETVSLDDNGYEVTSKDPSKTYTRKSWQNTSRIYNVPSSLR